LLGGGRTGTLEDDRRGIQHAEAVPLLAFA
jgi:hypothetical protein